VIVAAVEIAGAAVAVVAVKFGLPPLTSVV